MKEVIYNYDYLDFEDINNRIDRAKMLVENDNGEILLASSNNNYFLIGGHRESNETLSECVVREIKEESGIEIPFEERTPFLSIKYLTRNYPEEGINTLYSNNYYSIKYNLIPDLNNISLDEHEIASNFHLIYIHKNEILIFLYKSLKTCTKKGAVIDTIDAVEEYLKKEKH